MRFMCCLARMGQIGVRGEALQGAGVRVPAGITAAGCKANDARPVGRIG